MMENSHDTGSRSRVNLDAGHVQFAVPVRLCFPQLAAQPEIEKCGFLTGSSVLGMRSSGVSGAMGF